MSDNLIPPVYNLRKPGDLEKQRKRLQKSIQFNVDQDKRSEAAFNAVKELNKYNITQVAPSEQQIQEQAQNQSAQYNIALEHLKSIMRPAEAVKAIKMIEGQLADFNANWPGFQKFAGRVNMDSNYFRNYWTRYVQGVNDAGINPWDENFFLSQQKAAATKTTETKDTSAETGKSESSTVVEKKYPLLGKQWRETPSAPSPVVRQSPHELSAKILPSQRFQDFVKKTSFLYNLNPLNPNYATKGPYFEDDPSGPTNGPVTKEELESSSKALQKLLETKVAPALMQFKKHVKKHFERDPELGKVVLRRWEDMSEADLAKLLDKHLKDQSRVLKILGKFKVVNAPLDEELLYGEVEDDDDGGDDGSGGDGGGGGAGEAFREALTWDWGSVSQGTVAILATVAVAAAQAVAANPGVVLAALQAAQQYVLGAVRWNTNTLENVVVATVVANSPEFAGFEVLPIYEPPLPHGLPGPPAPLLPETSSTLRTTVETSSSVADVGRPVTSQATKPFGSPATPASGRRSTLVPQYTGPSSQISTPVRAIRGFLASDTPVEDIIQRMNDVAENQENLLDALDLLNDLKETGEAQLVAQTPGGGAPSPELQQLDQEFNRLTDSILRQLGRMSQTDGGRRRFLQMSTARESRNAPLSPSATPRNLQAAFTATVDPLSLPLGAIHPQYHTDWNRALAETVQSSMRSLAMQKQRLNTVVQNVPGFEGSDWYDASRWRLSADQYTIAERLNDLYHYLTTLTPPTPRRGRGAFKLRRRGLVIGRGLQPDEKPRLQQFGKYLLHVPSLEKNVLNIKFASDQPHPKLPRKDISDSFRELVQNLLKTGKLDATLFTKLTESERNYFEFVVAQCQIAKQLGLKEEAASDLNRFQILQGEVEAGNNNPKVLRELKNLTFRLMEKGKISKEDGAALLVEIAV